MKTGTVLTIYYDGLCHLCSREIDHYRKVKGAENFRFVDITDSTFDAQTEKLDPFQVHRVMHVRLANGEVKTAVEAFISIWDQLPQYAWMARLARKSFIKPILTLGYHGFARLRPYLPKKAKSCEESPYCELKSNPESKSTHSTD